MGEIVVRVGKWFCGAVVGCGLAYSILILTATPAFACTPADCSNINVVAESMCETASYGHAVSVTCPNSTGGFTIECTSGEINSDCG